MGAAEILRRPFQIIDGSYIPQKLPAVLPGKIKASGIVQVQGSIIKNRDPLYLFRSISGGSRGIWFWCCPGRSSTSWQKQAEKSKKHKHPFYHNIAAFLFNQRPLMVSPAVLRSFHKTSSILIHVLAFFIDRTSSILRPGHQILCNVMICQHSKSRHNTNVCQDIADRKIVSVGYLAVLQQCCGQAFL